MATPRTIDSFKYMKIERFLENDTEYFVATSDDLQGLVAEGKTIQEAIEIAEDKVIR